MIAAPRCRPVNLGPPPMLAAIIADGTDAAAMAAWKPAGGGHRLRNSEIATPGDYNSGTATNRCPSLTGSSSGVPGERMISTGVTTPV